MNRFIFVTVVFFLINFCCISCKKEIETIERLEILIENRTDSILYISLFPNEKFKKGNLYPSCEGCGGHSLTKFSLKPATSHIIKTENNQDTLVYRYDDKVLFKTHDLDIEPYFLASYVFDSIYISIANENNVIVKLTKENVTGYVENIFSENSTWDFRIYEWNMNMQFTYKKIKSHQYKFLILEDKILVK